MGLMLCLGSAERICSAHAAGLPPQGIPVGIVSDPRASTKMDGVDYNFCITGGWPVEKGCTTKVRDVLKQ